jgi:hypothetical protein
MKRKAATLLVIFMMLLVCLALLSRAVSVAGIANVRVVTASSQTITHAVSVEGVLMASGPSGYALDAAIPADEGQGILGRDVVATVTLADGTRIDGLPLLSGPSEDGSRVLVRAVMPEGAGTYVDGGRAQVEVVVASTDYMRCLPVESIYLEGSGRSYVYVVTEVSSLVGTELGVEKVYVAILDSNRVIVALDDASVTREQMVVVRSDRVISEDTRVRIAE